MTTVAQLIIQKLAAIEDRLTQIENRLDNQDAAFLHETVEPVKTATVAVSSRVTRKPRKRGRQRSHLPPRLNRALLADNRLAESTRNTYANTLRRLLETPQLIPALVDARNQGRLYEDIASDSELLLGREFTAKRLQNMVSVALRYDVIERTETGKYREGQAHA